MAQTCAICGKPLPQSISTGKPRRNARYCSIECLNEGKRRYAQEWYKSKSKDEDWMSKRSAKRKQRYEEWKDMRYKKHAEVLINLAWGNPDEINMSNVELYLKENFNLKV